MTIEIIPEDRPASTENRLPLCRHRHLGRSIDCRRIPIALNPSALHPMAGGLLAERGVELP